MKKLTTKEFIEKAKTVHGDKYNYSKVEYSTMHKKVCIICPIHGEFWQTPANHLSGKGCVKCGNENAFYHQSSRTEPFIEKAKTVHGDKYNYSKVEYKNTHTNVCIICPKHGEFWQTPANHLRGQGCPECAKTVRWDTRGRITTEEFIKRAKKVHGEKYNYSKVKCNSAKDKVCIICPEHGEFWQEAFAHLQGQKCPKCIGRNKTTEEWIEEAKKVHGNKYNYSKTVYVDCYTKVCIICPIHGEFWQLPSAHLQGHECYYCNRGLNKQYKFNLLEEFESEYDFRAFLANNDVNILYVILRNIEPKFEPLKRDIERALAHSDEVDPIKALRDKYTSDSEDVDEEFEIATAPNIDLDDDNAIDSIVYVDNSKKDNTPTIDEVIRNTEREIKVINKIEHMLTPQDREYIMNKFLNDKRRTWMLKRENTIK